jgi:hypothetical protein
MQILVMGQVFEVSLGGVLLFIRKAEDFGTSMGNQVVSKGSSEETSKLTLDVFLLKTMCS